MDDSGRCPRRARRARRYQIAFSVPAAIGSVAAMAQEGVEKDETALLTALAVMALGLCCFIAFVVYRMVQSVRGVRRDPLRRVSKNDPGLDDGMMYRHGDSGGGDSGN